MKKHYMQINKDIILKSMHHSEQITLDKGDMVEVFHNYYSTSNRRTIKVKQYVYEIGLEHLNRMTDKEQKLARLLYEI